MRGQRSIVRDVLGGILITAALAVPLLPLASDGTAQMHVAFRTGDMAKPRAFTTATSRSVCAVMAAALTYENPDTGTYTRVACSE
jgi:hypothetical protein